MKILVDGVFFQLASSGIARLWSSVLPRLALLGDLDLIVLDRGGLPDIPGAKVIPFPSYKDRYSADDSFLLQKLCDYFEIDVFISTYYTSCISTPMLLILYDMIPELLDFDLSRRFWQEKEIAISFARRFITISETTKRDLLRFYPEIPHENVSVAYLGCDRDIFKQPETSVIEAFRKRIGFDRPYFLLVGSREQTNGYKNTHVFFKALGQTNDGETDVLCLGGEEDIEHSSQTQVPDGCRIKRIVVSDTDIGAAYAGAIALIYPSLYEGFGLPVLEAMATGCPVITTTNGALAEITGDACIIVDAHSVTDMVSALQEVQVARTREDLISKGSLQATKFDWSHIVEAIEREGRKLVETARSGAFTEFFADWKLLRDHQSSVDIEML